MVLHLVGLCVRRIETHVFVVHSYYIGVLDMQKACRDDVVYKQVLYGISNSNNDLTNPSMLAAGPINSNFRLTKCVDCINSVFQITIESHDPWRYH